MTARMLISALAVPIAGALVAAVAAAACSDLDGLAGSDPSDGGNDASSTTDAAPGVQDSSPPDAVADAKPSDGGCTMTPFLLGAFAESLPEGGTGWTNPQNALTLDGGNATHSLSPNDTSDILRVSDFRFGVPAQASVTGVTVKVLRAENSGAQVVDAEVNIGSAASGPSGSRASAETWPNIVFAEGLYGGQTEDWGLALTAAIVNASDFGVSLSARQTANGATTLQVDSITMAVRYCE